MNGFARDSPTRGNGDDRRQRRKQGGAVGAAASGMQATAQQTLGAATRPCLRSRLRGCTKTEPFLCRKVRLVTSLPVSFCRSLWYTYFAPGACALTPDQQDGVGGKKTCCCCRRTCFFKLYADKLEKRRFTQNVQPQKIADYFGIIVEELMDTKKSPPGWASSTNRCRKLWSCFLLYL